MTRRPREGAFGVRRMFQAISLITLVGILLCLPIGTARAQARGTRAMRSVKIDPSLLKPEDVEMVEDLVLAAFTDAKGKVEGEMQNRMQQVAGGLPLPPGLKLF